MYKSSLSKVKKQGTLLFDSTSVAFTSGCELQFYSAVKDPASPMIHGTEVWEGMGVYTFGSRLLACNEKYRLYYVAYDPAINRYTTGVAESENGLDWKKPELGECLYFGKSVKYSMCTDGDDVSGRARSVVYDPRPDCPEDQRYKGMAFTYEGNKAYLSPDGLNWREYENNPIWFATSDIIHCMWDDRLGKFVTYFKLWRLRAEQLHESGETSELDGLFVTFDEKNLGNDRTEIDGVRVYLTENAPAKVCKEKFIIRSGELSSDDGGGGHLSGNWYTRRVVCRAESDDFIHWGKEQVVLENDERDRDDANIQIAQVFRMGGYYIAFLNMHDQRGFFEQQIAFSSDGIKWNRPWRGNLISRGIPGEFDSGMVTQPVDPIVIGSKMIIYYGGCTGGHVGTDGIFSIGRALMRKDGFACHKSLNGKIAVLRTVLFEIKEKEISLNANAEGGRITAALFDENGKEIKGYCHENCIPLSEDSASFEECYMPVSWQDKTELPKGKISIELRFENAEIYSILI